MPIIADLEAQISEELLMLDKIRIEVDDWINGITDIEVQLILSLRFEDGLSWEKVAEELETGEGKISGDAVRMICKRFLKQNLEPDS